MTYPLKQAQRRAFVAITRSYQTVPIDTLCILANALSIQQLLSYSAAEYMIKERIDPDGLKSKQALTAIKAAYARQLGDLKAAWNVDGKTRRGAETLSLSSHRSKQDRS